MVIKFTPYVEEEVSEFTSFVKPITSRQNAILGIMKQGYGNPNQILDFLNYDEQGNKIGDFTLDEVIKLQPKADKVPDNIISIAEELTGIKLKDRNVSVYNTALAQNKQGSHLGASTRNTIITDLSVKGLSGETPDSNLIHELIHTILTQAGEDKKYTRDEVESMVKDAEFYYLAGGKGLAPSFKSLENYGKGNIDLSNRPQVKNPDGSISTIRSISFNENGKEILIPTIIDGKIVSDQEAINYYHKTGEYLGKFDTIKESDKYAEKLHKEQEEIIKKVPKFIAFEEEKPVFTPLEKIEGEQMFTPYFEPYVMTSPQIRDMAKIMGVSAEPELEPSMGWEYVPAKVYSYLLEEPLYETARTVNSALEAGFNLVGLPKAADYFKRMKDVGAAPPISESVGKQTAYLRDQAYKESTEMGTAFDISQATTRLGSLLVQVTALGKIPALKPTGIYKRMSTMATHGFFTTPGEVKDKVEASVYRVAYWSTPFIAQHWGAVGLKAITIDTALNTFLTSPSYIRAFKEAEKTGDWTAFTSQAVTQFTMDIGMALNTRGLPAAQRTAALKSYLKTQARQFDMPYSEFKSIINSFDKAYQPKTEIERVALAKQEAKMQKLLDKDDADVRLETLAKDADKAPINKLIERNETNPIPGIQDKVNKVAMELPTNAQKAKVHILAKYKGLLTTKDKEKAVYKKYIESLTGEKSTKAMNQGQIKMVIDNLDRMDIRTAKALSRTPIKEINSGLLRLIKGIGEIGYKEKYRNPYEVFSKMGLVREIYLPSRDAEVAKLDDKMEFMKEVYELRKLRGHGKESPQRIFDSIENPKEKIVLNSAETRGRKFAKRFADDWANKLKIPKEKRREHYITHIFEKSMEESLKHDNSIDPDIMRAFEFGAIPKTVFNPFLQARMGREYGLKRDVWAALEAYENQALKVFHYEPILKKMNTYARFLPDLSHKYMSNYSRRMTNRPLDIDKGINNDIIEIMKAIEKSTPMQKTALKKIAPYLNTNAQGNMAGRLAYYYTGILYETALGGRPISAIRNLGQGTLTVAEVGPMAYMKGIEMLMTKAGRDILHKSVIYRSRKYALLPGYGDYMPEKLRKISQATLMYLFKTADKFNVSSAFCAGYQEANRLGLPEKVCMERGDEVAEKTQYMYTKMASPEFNQAATGKILGVFTSWPRNYLELLNHWYKGDVSEVYRNYESETGTKVYPESWAGRHRSAIIYSMMAALALYAEKKTRLKATQYVGFRTIETLPRILGGQLAGLRLPLALFQTGVGVIGQNRPMLKQGLKNLNPIDWFIIKKELEDFDGGKKDWQDLLFYRSKPKFRLR